LNRRTEHERPHRGEPYLMRPGAERAQVLRADPDELHG
jgi:hypothetical protein